MANNARVIAQLRALESIPWVAPVAGAERVADIARGIAPVDTGFLRDHIIARHLGRSSQVESLAPYSGFVEFGTRFMSAQPFLRPAVDQHTREILAVVAEALNGQIHIVLRGGSSKWQAPASSSSAFPGQDVIVQQGPGRTIGT